LSIYPNPAVNRTLTLRLQKESSVQVYNSQGVLVLQKIMTAGEHSLFLGQLGKGVYTVKANDESSLIVVQ
jgi:hypothetical protein